MMVTWQNIGRAHQAEFKGAWALHKTEEQCYRLSTVYNTGYWPPFLTCRWKTFIFNIWICFRNWQEDLWLFLLQIHICSAFPAFALPMHVTYMVQFSLVEHHYSKTLTYNTKVNLFARSLQFGYNAMGIVQLFSFGNQGFMGNLSIRGGWWWTVRWGPNWM